MNIVLMHYAVKAILDQVNTPRFDSWQIDDAISKASRYITKYKIAGTIENGQRVSFQKVQILRDELYTLVKEIIYDPSNNLPDVSFAFTNNELIPKANIPSDYRYMIGLYIEINANTKKDWCSPITYDEYRKMNKNPYGRASQAFPYHFYCIESDKGFKVFYGKDSGDTLDYSEMIYVSEPVSVVLGTKYTAGQAPTGSDYLAYTDVVYNSVTYKKGSAVNITTPAQFTSGTVVKASTNSDMPLAIHDEIIDEAAVILNNNVENYNRWKMLREEKMIKKQ
jgi:hypothetical protein